MMRRVIACAVACVLLAESSPAARAQASGARPVVFVHGMGGNAADIGTTQFTDLLKGISRSHPSGDVCQRDAQPDRPWTGSPCVFRYVDDAAETDGGPNDSQSPVKQNADKLAREIDEVSGRAGGERIVLVGYSMGGAIIRTYLAEHRAQAEKRIAAVVLVDAVASGSWGYAFAGAVPRRVGGRLGDKLNEVMRSMAASSASVNFDRPATHDLQPRSELFRTIAQLPVPRGMNYYTFWGDIRISIERRLLTYGLPAYDMPSVGDLGLLPGDPDPAKLPELGGQRFSPKVDAGHEALDVPHKTHIALDARVIGELISQCGHEQPDGGARCKAIVANHFNVPNTHTAIPVSMAHVMIDDRRFGGRVSLLNAVLQAIGRNT